VSGFRVREISKVLEHLGEGDLKGRARFEVMVLLLQYLKLFFLLVDIFFFLREDGFAELWQGVDGRERNFSKGVIYCLWEMGNGKWSGGGGFDQNAGV